jgi:hypothetical protein
MAPVLPAAPAGTTALPSPVASSTPAAGIAGAASVPAARASTAGVSAAPPISSAPLPPSAAGRGPATTAPAAGVGAPPAPGGGASAPAGPSGDAAACPAAPAAATPLQVQALMIVNMSRVAAGSGCANMLPALNMSATQHCMYNAMNAGNAMCQAGRHSEVMSCTGFSGTDVAMREKAAGYSAAGSTEVLTSYGNMPGPAIKSWIDTVWHRIPVLDPWTVDLGYGGATGCDIIDFGRGMPTAPADKVVVWPYDGQTMVPPSFSGRESPVPPAPSEGWPSSYPINLYAQKLTVSEHVLTKDGDATPIPHVWMDGKSSNVDPGYRYYLNNTAFMYGEKPFEPNTRYRVRITGTHSAGPLAIEWTFTTGAASRF